MKKRVCMYVTMCPAVGSPANNGDRAEKFCKRAAQRIEENGGGKLDIPNAFKPFPEASFAQNRAALLGLSDALYDLADGTDVKLGSGDFVILWPQDAHVPQLQSDSPSDVPAGMSLEESEPKDDEVDFSDDDLDEDED